MDYQSQQDYLKTAKAILEVEWDTFAEMAGIKPRAFKTYRMPNTSKDHRTLPNLARNAIDRLLDDQKKRKRKSLRSS